MGTREEWQAYIAELHGKTHEQRVAEAIIRLMNGRRKQRLVRTIEDEDERDKMEGGIYG